MHQVGANKRLIASDRGQLNEAGVGRIHVDAALPMLVALKPLVVNVVDRAR